MRLALPFRPVIVRALAFSLAVNAAAFMFSQQPASAPVDDVVDHYFGQAVADPYRWMEKGENNPELAQFLKAENDYTHSILARIPGRDKLLARISALDQAGARITSVQLRGGRYFYLKREPGAEIAKLSVRDSLKGPERILVDPGKMSGKDSHYAIDFYEASRDGKLVAYGLSEGGSEESVIRVVAVDTAAELPDQIDRCIYSYVSWYRDDKSFFYLRVNKLPAGAPADMRFKKLRVYWHKLGTNPDDDPAVFGYAVSKNVPVDDDIWPNVIYSPASPFLIATGVHGVKHEQAIYAARAPKGDITGPIEWRKITDERDGVVRVEVRGDQAFLLTHHGASKYKIVETNLSKPDIAHAKIVVPQGRAVITNMSVATDGLYFTEMDGGISQVRRIGFKGGAATVVPLPFRGAVLDRDTDPNQPGILLLLTSWTKPPVWITYDPATGKITDTGLAPPWPIDFSGITSVEVSAKSRDGTIVPLSIVYQRGMRMDGSHPTLLTGYGAYGLSLLPTFDPTRLAWLERGGVLAFAHVRGGGEYGDDWHRAGMQAKKMNSIYDFLACAEYLVKHKYTSPQKLAGTGRSAGGLLIGRAITERPELFAAALIIVGLSDPLRLETMQGGPENAPEFGTVTTKEGFHALFEMDPYQHVRRDTAYPAVLLASGANDSRVAVWQAAKMAARLQAASSSGRPILLRIVYDSGHGFGSTRTQFDIETADEWSFLLWQLGDDDFHPHTSGSN